MAQTGHTISAFAMYAQKRKNEKEARVPCPKKAKKKSVHFEPTLSSQTHTTRTSKAKQKNKLKANKASVFGGVKTMKRKNQCQQNEPSNSIKKRRKKKVQKKKNAASQDEVVQQAHLQQRVQDVSKLTHSPLPNVDIEAVQIKYIIEKQEAFAKSNSKIPIVGSPLDSQVSNRVKNDNPLESSRSMFEWMIHPVKVDEFIGEYWEKTPVHIKRGRPGYYKFLMSTQLIDKILRESYIQFSKNIDITSYANGVRETHNPLGRALPSVVWDYYLNGCSVRMLNPQTYIPKLHVLNATLQEFFGCFVGANSYLTPPDSQGFAPHYDDIEAFILQIEGKKRWRLYKPRHQNEYLSRFSSRNFEQTEIGEPIFDAVIEAGDILYFPRGTIHQGVTVDDVHSLHLTLSVYQRNCWGDFLEKLLPDALRTAIESDVEFREGLPLDYLRHSGFVHRENQSPAKDAFKERVKNLFSRILSYIDVDKAADEMAKGHIHDFLPPVPFDLEKECSVLEDGEEMTADGVVENRVEIEPDTRIRLLRSHCLRLTEEAGVTRIYYSTENSKEYHEYELQFLEIGKEFVPAVKELILRYPSFIRVEDLPLAGEDDKIQIAKDLWEKCIVITEHPLCVLE